MRSGVKNPDDIKLDRQGHTIVPGLSIDPLINPPPTARRQK